MDKGERLTIDCRAKYIIRIQGYLNERWSDRIGGATIETHDDSAEAPVTELTTEFQDQAALVGVLTTLYDLQLPLLSVECVDIKRVA